MGTRLSENEKTIGIALLFPLFWPFIPVLLICMAGEGIRNKYWQWKCRRTMEAIRNAQQNESK